MMRNHEQRNIAKYRTTADVLVVLLLLLQCGSSVQVVFTSSIADMAGRAGAEPEDQEGQQGPLGRAGQARTKGSSAGYYTSSSSASGSSSSKAREKRAAGIRHRAVPAAFGVTSLNSLLMPQQQLAGPGS
jgi:hypothetical protein